MGRWVARLDLTFFMIEKVQTFSDSSHPSPATNEIAKAPKAPAPEYCALLRPNSERRPKLESSTKRFFCGALLYSTMTKQFGNNLN